MAGSTAEVLTPDGDADEERGIETAELYANLYTIDGQLRTTDMFDDPVEEAPNAPVPEPIVFTEFTLGERGLRRRYRQQAVGVHAGYLMLRRQSPVAQRHNADGSVEYRLQ